MEFLGFCGDLPARSAKRPAAALPPARPTKRQKQPPAPIQKLQVCSVCSGLGTESWALTNLGKAHTLVFCCEIDDKLRDLLTTNHHPKMVIKDAMSQEFIDSPMEGKQVHVLIGGFPCQPFSLAGRGDGFEDSRGTVIFNIIRWISKHSPLCFILENVDGLRTAHPESFLNILKALKKIGSYNVSWQLVNSKDHGVPQVQIEKAMIQTSGFQQAFRKCKL